MSNRCIAVFDSAVDAEKAVEWLIQQEVPIEDITVVTNDKTPAPDSRDEVIETPAEDDVMGIADSALGVAVGAATGAFPGTGPFALNSVGPYSAAGAAAVGAATGTFGSALAGWGMTPEEQEYYTRHLDQGATLVVANLSDSRLDKTRICDGLTESGGQFMD